MSIRATYGLPRSFAVDFDVPPPEAPRRPVAVEPAAASGGPDASLPEDYYVASNANSRNAPANARQTAVLDAAANARMRNLTVGAVAIKAAVRAYKPPAADNAPVGNISYRFSEIKHAVQHNYRLLWFDRPESESTVETEA